MPLAVMSICALKSIAGLTPAEAIVLARGIEEFHPYFYEDPILPDNFDAMALVASKYPNSDCHRRTAAHDSRISGVAAPWRRAICAPGRLHGRRHHPLQENRCPCRGASCRRCAPQPAEPGQHCRLHSTCRLHPKFCPARISVGRECPSQKQYRPQYAQTRKWILIIPNAPGIGVELVEDAAERYPYRPLKVHTRLHVDGSVWIRSVSASQLAGCHWVICNGLEKG